MSSLEMDIEITADGGVKLLSPLPAWFRPGRAHVVMTLATEVDVSIKTKRQIPVATPAMLARRVAAYEALHSLGGLGDVIPDPLAWQREMREDSPPPGRE